MENPNSPVEPEISLAVPFFNEESGIDLFFERVIPVLDTLGTPFEIVCVNDGSRDRTWELLLNWVEKDSRIRAIDLSRNFGKEAALTAALDHCLGKAIIPIDADLQDPPELISEMVSKWREGFEVIVARRRSRNYDTLGKKFFAHWFYKLFNWISDTEIIENAGDYRLMDQKVVAALDEMGERNRFMKGLFSWVGFRTFIIEFDREPRASGEDKWRSLSLWDFALDGLFAFSSLPLRMWVLIGALVSLFSFAYGSFLIIRTLIYGVDVPGYASIMVVMLFLGGVQLIGLGVLGEYLGRVYREVKQRPLYIIRDSSDSETNEG